MEGSHTTATATATATAAATSMISPWLLRNLITSIFIYTEKFLSNLAEKHKLLQLIRYVLLTSFLFFLRFLPSLNPNFDNKPPKTKAKYFSTCSTATTTCTSDHEYHKYYMPAAAAGSCTSDSAIARALSQLLSIVNDIPVSSRKYQLVRSLAETLIDENNREGVEALRQVNRKVLSSAFSTTLSHLEAAATLEQGCQRGTDAGQLTDYRLSRVVRRAIRSLGDVAWTRGSNAQRVGEGPAGSSSSAEKLAAELLWLAEKLTACGYAEEAVRKWASASNLAWLSISAEPRLQSSFVKISALLFKHAKDMGTDEADDESSSNKKEEQKHTKMQMLLSWLPLLCRASNGSDVPVMSIGERTDLERVLEETIEMLEQQEDQEKVLSLWLHHFTYCSYSDWPNLYASYARWCDASRKLLIHQL